MIKSIHKEIDYKELSDNLIMQCSRYIAHIIKLKDEVKMSEAVMFKKYAKWCETYDKLHEAIKVPFNSIYPSRMDGSTYYILVPADKYQSFEYDSDKIYWIDKECIVVSLDEYMILFAKHMAQVPGDEYEDQLKEFKLKYIL